MARGTAARKEEPGRELVIRRDFDVPARALFQAFTDPEWVRNWWGPKGFTTPFCRIDLRVGGVFHYCMRSPEGKDYWGKGVYREIAEPERLVFIDMFSDEAGNAVSPKVYGMAPDRPEEVLTTITFEETDGRTALTIHAGVTEEMAGRSGAREGWEESLDRLSGFLSDK